MVTKVEPADGTCVHALDRIAARALHAGRPGAARIVPTWSAEAKDRLYRRMFPDASCSGAMGTGTTSDAPVPVIP